MKKENNTRTGLGVLLKQPLESVLCLLLVAIVAVTFGQVLFRYVFQWSLAWTEELARFLFMWLAAIAAAYAFKTKSHFALRFLVDRFGARHRMLIAVLVRLSMAIFLIVFIWKALEYTHSVVDQIGPGTGLSMAVPYASSVVGGVLMLYYMLKNGIEEWRVAHESNSSQVQ